ncbi:hypothetical protein N7520_001494 [Penicillium odoratum]|uniref:uncharacterized protein n=1 Tax=Penicillium odoratum TaxID=1167516 RepID=UPI002549771B|nr:uncharacterized protein N7520_001494 [Penicillium odoratum]KAJ5778248.1 hypothetical protein N7520_001494 [Penicillium odoratum]
MPPKRNRGARSLGETCQRCFLRLARFPDHFCMWNEDYRACQHCRNVRHRCHPLPLEFQDEAEEAMLGPANLLAERVQVMLQKVRRRTHKVNQERAFEEPATAGMHESEEKGEDKDEDCNIDAAAEEQLHSSLATTEDHGDSEIDEAAEEQLQSSLAAAAERGDSDLNISAEHQLHSFLTAAAVYEDSETDDATGEQSPISLASEAREVEPQQETEYWYSQNRLGRWTRT